MSVETWLVPGLLGAAIIEALLSATWNRAYFSIGFPLFFTEVPVAQAPLPTPTAANLEHHAKGDSFTPLAFHRGTGNTLFFRERLLDFALRIHYTPVMHGKIVFDHQRAIVAVTGLANWFPLLFLAFAAWLAPSAPFFRLFALVAIALVV